MTEELDQILLAQKALDEAPVPTDNRFMWRKPMTDDNIRSLGAIRAERGEDNRLWTPIECLEDAIRDLRKGVLKADRMHIVFCDTGDGTEFNIRHYSCNASASQLLAMLEIAKVKILGEMGYLSDP